MFEEEMFREMERKPTDSHAWVEGVIFDMDGLMFDTERLGLEGWRRAGEIMGYPIGEDIVARVRGCNRTDGERIFKDTYGEDFDYARGRKIRVDYADGEIAARGVPLKPGLRELLEFLKKRGIRMAVATGTERKKAYSWMEDAGILSYFGTVVCGDDVSHAKPWPDIFIRTCGELGINCEKAIVLEDSTNGVEAAYRAGCKPVMIPDLTPPDEMAERRCYRIFRRLDEVIELFAVQPEKSATVQRADREI